MRWNQHLFAAYSRGNCHNNEKIYHSTDSIKNFNGSSYIHLNNTWVLFHLSYIDDFKWNYRLFRWILARKYNLTSHGKILDPIADKILITFSLIAISIYLDSFFVACLSALIISREIWVSGLRDFNSATGNFGATDVTFLAKFKTTFQILTIFLYLIVFS